MPRLDEIRPTRAVWENEPGSWEFDLVERRTVAVVRFDKYLSHPWFWRVGDDAGGSCNTAADAMERALDVYLHGDPDREYAPIPYGDGEGDG